MLSHHLEEQAAVETSRTKAKHKTLVGGRLLWPPPRPKRIQKVSASNEPGARSRKRLPCESLQLKRREMRHRCLEGLTHQCQMVYGMHRGVRLEGVEHAPSRTKRSGSPHEATTNEELETPSTWFADCSKIEITVCLISLNVSASPFWTKLCSSLGAHAQ